MPVDNAGREPGDTGYNRAEAETRDDARHERGRRGGPGGAHEGGAAGPGSSVKKHRDVILISLTVVGVIIGYLTMRRSSTPASDPALAGAAPGSGTTPTSGDGLGTPGSPTGGGALDGFAAYLSNISDELAKLQPGAAPAPGAPVPAVWSRPSSYSASGWASEPGSEPAHVLFGAAARGLRYVRNLTTGAIYQVNPNGKLAYLSAANYAELGNPKYTSFHGPKPPPPRPPHGTPTGPHPTPKPGVKPR